MSATDVLVLSDEMVHTESGAMCSSWVSWKQSEEMNRHRRSCVIEPAMSPRN